jgi:hypothetical protein
VDEDAQVKQPGPVEAKYSNFFEIGINALEFIIDFGQAFEGASEKPMVHTRIVTNPVHAQVLEALLNKVLAEYERKYGLDKDTN